jgi:hypothetical protein
MVEITTDQEGVVVQAAPGTNPVLLDCEVVGAVIGVPAQKMRVSEKAAEEKPLSITFLPPPPMSAAVDTIEAVHVADSQGVPQQSGHTGSTASRTAPPPHSSFWRSPPSPVPIAVFASVIAVLLVLLLLSLVIPRPSGQDTRIRELTRQKDEATTQMAILRQELAQERDKASARIKELQRERDNALSNMDRWSRRATQVEEERHKALAKTRELEQQRDKTLVELGAMIEAERLAQETKVADDVNDRPGLLRLAEAGNSVAQYRVGLYHRWGHMRWGFGTDQNVAVKWLQKAARQGHPVAQWHLRDMGESW